LAYCGALQTAGFGLSVHLFVEVVPGETTQQSPERKTAMQTIPPEQLQASENYAGAFMALSQVAFSSVERLTALNLKVARAALDDGMAAANSLIQVENAGELKDLQGHFIGPAAEQCSTYLRSVQEITVESQQQIGELLTSYLATLGIDAKANGGWSTGSDLFSQFVEQTKSLFEANAKAAGDATEKMMAPVSPHTKKAA